VPRRCFLACILVVLAAVFVSQRAVARAGDDENSLTTKNVRSKSQIKSKKPSSIDWQKIGTNPWRTTDQANLQHSRKLWQSRTNDVYDDGGFRIGNHYLNFQTDRLVKAPQVSSCMEQTSDGECINGSPFPPPKANPDNDKLIARTPYLGLSITQPLQ